MVVTQEADVSFCGAVLHCSPALQFCIAAGIWFPACAASWFALTLFVPTLWARMHVALTFAACAPGTGTRSVRPWSCRGRLVQAFTCFHMEPTWDRQIRKFSCNFTLLAHVPPLSAHLILPAQMCTRALELHVKTTFLSFTCSLQFSFLSLFPFLLSAHNTLSV